MIFSFVHRGHTCEGVIIIVQAGYVSALCAADHRFKPDSVSLSFSFSFCEMPLGFFSCAPVFSMHL